MFLNRRDALALLTLQPAAGPRTATAGPRTARRQFSPHEALGDRANIKSYSVHPRTGRIVFIQAEGKDWWAEHLHFQQPEGLLRLQGERLYKARWI